MSDLHVKVIAIDEVRAHPNADRLELAVVGGWNCVVAKGHYQAGDAALYIPIDSVLPPELEARIFPPDSKVKLNKSRVRTIKLRGAISQGLIVRLDEIGLSGVPVGTDVRERLGITKYEPPDESTPNLMRAGRASRYQTNPHFRKYTDIENLKNYNRLFEPGEMVHVSEKLHGTSARYGYFPTVANTWWKKIKRFFGMLPAHEFCLGSRNVQLQDRGYDGFYEQNVYGKIAKQERLAQILDPGEAVYGEIIGSGVQKGYTYGCAQGEHRLYVYDVMIDGRWIDSAELDRFCRLRGLTRVPKLYVGPFDAEHIAELRCGDSVIGGQKCREGVVVRATTEQMTTIGRKILKFINDEYLLGEQTDFH
jgi:RNA ligase (TIGR02306 family)